MLASWKDKWNLKILIQVSQNNQMKLVRLEAKEGNITTDTDEIQKTLKIYLKSLYLSYWIIWKTLMNFFMHITYQRQIKLKQTIYIDL